MNLSFKLLFIIIFFLNCPSTLLAAKFHWKFSIDLKKQSLGDQEIKIPVGDWNCTVGIPSPDNAGTEARRIGCGIGDGLQAYLLPVCYKDKKTGKTRFEGGGIISLQQKNTGSLQVALTCE